MFLRPFGCDFPNLGLGGTLRSVYLPAEMLFPVSAFAVLFFFSFFKYGKHVCTALSCSVKLSMFASGSAECLDSACVVIVSCK